VSPFKKEGTDTKDGGWQEDGAMVEDGTPQPPLAAAPLKGSLSSSGVLASL